VPYVLNIILSFISLPVCISDEIIKLNKNKPVFVPGNVSRETWQSQGRRIGKGNKNYRSNAAAVAVQGRFQGQGRRFNQVTAFSLCCMLIFMAFDMASGVVLI
jgi:hypothetical protein